MPVKSRGSCARSIWSTVNWVEDAEDEDVDDDNVFSLDDALSSEVEDAKALDNAVVHKMVRKPCWIARWIAEWMDGWMSR